MNIQFSLDASTQPLLAVFVNADNMKDVLSEPVFSSDLLQWVTDADFTGKDGSSVTMPNAALANAGAVKTVLIVGGTDERTAAGSVGYIAKKKVSLGLLFSTFPILSWQLLSVY